jgi:hypothetical protein
LEDNGEEPFDVYLGKGGTKFSYFSVSSKGRPMIIVNKDHKELKMSIFEGMFGTSRLRFSAGTLINIFESIVSVAVYKEKGIPA